MGTGGSNRGFTYDPKRWTKEWKEYMNSPEVIREQKRVVKSVREYQDRKREQNERNARDYGRCEE